MPLEIIRDDITNLKADIIVNSANSQLLASGGACGAIFEKAGREKLQKACNKLAPIETTQAVITKGYNLNCKYIIHTLAPVWNDGKSNEAEQLFLTYMNCLNLALNKKAKSIAFPLLASGHFGFPKSKALDIATTAIKEFLLDNDMDIYIVVFDKKAFLISESLFKSVKEYIDDKYVDDSPFARMANRSIMEDMEFSVSSIDSDDYFTPSYSVKEKCMEAIPKQKKSASSKKRPTISKKVMNSMSLDEALKNIDETFSETLFKLIDISGKTDAQIYKRANIDRRLFSKIRSNKNYTPSKNTILSLAIALELPLDETKRLLEKAGYALSHSNKFDIIVEYFIINKNYDIHEINETLFSFEQNTLRV